MKKERFLQKQRFNISIILYFVFCIFTPPPLLFLTLYKNMDYF